MHAIDQSGKLERALRFADLAINAVAVPVPVDLTTPVVPQDDVSINDAADNVQTEGGHAESTAHSEPETQHDAAIPQFVTDEAVLKSLASAIDAVHDSLRPNSAAALQGPSQAFSETPYSDATFTPLVPSTAQSAGPLVEPISSSVESQHMVAIDHAIAVTNDISVIPQQVNSTLYQPIALQDVAHVVQSVESTIESVTHAVTSTLNSLLGDNSADSGAVTIPSLGGLGLDALVGLLHPASPTPGSSHSPDPALSGLQDSSIFAAIGLQEVVHADQDLAHASHSPFHLVGSGLI